jgi:hypothetical protein
MNGHLTLAPFLTGLRVSSLPLWLTWFWFTNRSLLQLPSSAVYYSTAENSLTNASESRLTHSSRVESYVTIDSQSASVSWNKAPIWGIRPYFYYCQTVAGLLLWGAFSDERTGLSFTVAAGPRQRTEYKSPCLTVLLLFCFSCVYSLPRERAYRSVAQQWTSMSVRCYGNVCLASRWLAMDFCSGSTIPAFRCRVTI